MGVDKSDFSEMHRSRSDLIKNAERFVRIDLDLKKNATNKLTAHYRYNKLNHQTFFKEMLNDNKYTSLL